MTEIFDRLAAPIRPDAIHWRSQAISGDGKTALALAYMDARDVMARLDETVGPANWQDSYEETPKGRVICTLRLRINEEWIAKSDGAGVTDVEGDKGALSDALKRAAVKWGIGRFLYDMPATWAECESYEQGGKKKWKGWTQAGQRKLEAIAGKAPMARTSEPDASLQIMLDAVAACDTQLALKRWWKDHGAAVQDGAHTEQIVAAIDARTGAIELMDRARA